VGPALRVIIAAGKFHGVIAAHTPTDDALVGGVRRDRVAIDALSLLAQALDECGDIGAMGFRPLRAKGIIGAAMDDSPILPAASLADRWQTLDPKAPTLRLGPLRADRPRPLAQGICRIETDQGPTRATRRAKWRSDRG
jgi:hypothetical protein